MIPQETLDLWFTYRRPTEQTLPRLQAILAAHLETQQVVANSIAAVEEGDLPPLFEAVNTSMRNFADVINDSAPDGADKAAAMRCIRLARMAANEALLVTHALSQEASPDGLVDRLHAMGTICETELLKAHWQANAAIACEEAER